MISTTGSTKYNTFISLAILAAIAIIYSLMSLWTPMMLDDYIFKAAYLRHNNLSDHFNLQALMAYMKEVRDCDNSRIPNLIAPFSTTIAPWKDIFPIFTGLCVATIIALASRFIAGYKICKYPLCIAMVWLACIILIPWRNNLFVAAFSLNYIYPACGMLIFITIAMHSQSAKSNLMAATVLCLIAFPSGMWHEGFTLPTFAGFLMISLRNIKKWKWWWWFAGFLFAAGAFTAAMAPGTLSRANSQFAFAPYLSTVMIADYAGVGFLCSLLVLPTCIRRGRKSLKKSFSSDLFTLFFTAMCAGLCLSLILPHSPRMAFYPDICAIICSGLIIRNILVENPNALSLFTKGYKAAGFIALIISSAQSAAAIIWQHALYEEEKTIMPLIKESPSGTVFYNYLDPYDIPLYTLYFPVRGEWVSAFTYITMHEYMSVTGKDGDHTNYPAVVPLDFFCAAAGTYPSGLVTDSLFTSEPRVVNLSGTIEYESGDAIHVSRKKCMALPFTTVFGDKLIFIHPLGKGNNKIKEISYTEITSE